MNITSLNRRQASSALAFLAYGEEGVHELGRRAGIARGEADADQVRSEGLDVEASTDLLQILRFI